MIVLGYLFAIIIGLLLGLIGAGGSILTIPLLFYFFKIPISSTATYSLIIIGFSSVIGSVVNIRAKHFSLPTILQFGIPSVIAVMLTRWWFVPLIPETIHFGNFAIHKEKFLLMAFAVLLIVAALGMIKKKSISKNQTSKPNMLNSIYANFWGAMVGFITGVIGLGGGFLIVPAISYFFSLSMKTAIGTSLIIIAMNAFVGTISSHDFYKLDYTLLGSLILCNIVGLFIGILISKRIDNELLKKLFSWGILLLGIGILLQQFI